MFLIFFLSFFASKSPRVFSKKNCTFGREMKRKGGPGWSLSFHQELPAFWWDSHGTNGIFTYMKITKINHSGKYTLRAIGIRNGIFSGNKKYHVFHIEPSTLCPRWMWRCSLWPNWDLLHLGLNQVCCWGEGEEYGKAAIYDDVIICIHEHQPFMLDKWMPCL